MFTIYSADVTGNPGNCSYPHKHVILDEASLKDGICHDYVCAEYRNNYRNGDNFIGSDCLPVDCDNDHTEDPAGWKTPEDVMDIPIGGLGILTAKRSVDDMTYERIDGSNVVTIIKKW